MEINLNLRIFLASLALIALAPADQIGTPLIVAHRGASHDAPENTLAAFQLAWQKDADAIEGDFFLTKDRKIICIHDRTTERLNKAKVKLDVAKSTLKELRTLDVGSWKHQKWKGERMPTLEEVIATIPTGKKIFIEVKCGPEIIPVLKSILKASQLKAEQIVVISFQQAVILEAKKTMPHLKAYWLSSIKRTKGTGYLKPSEAEIIQTLKTTKADGLSCGDTKAVTPGLLSRVRKAGYETHCWTVDDPKRAKGLAKMGMQSITTNRPALIRKALSKSQSP